MAGPVKDHGRFPESLLVFGVQVPTKVLYECMVDVLDFHPSRALSTDADLETRTVSAGHALAAIARAFNAGKIAAVDEIQRRIDELAERNIQ